MKFIFEFYVFAKKGVELWLYSCISGWTQKIFTNYGQHSCVFTQVFIPYWCNPTHCGKSRRWYHLGLNQPPVFFSWNLVWHKNAMTTWMLDTCIIDSTWTLHYIGPTKESNSLHVHVVVSYIYLWEVVMHVDVEHSQIPVCETVPRRNWTIIYVTNTCRKG